MSRNEIRLRRQRIAASGSNRFRNYGDVLERHERDMKIKKMIRAFVMFILILALVATIFFLSRVEEGTVPVDSKKPTVLKTLVPDSQVRSARCDVAPAIDPPPSFTRG